MPRLALLLAPLVLSGCALLDGRCTYEVRSLTMAGRLSGAGQPAGEPPLVVELSLHESRGGPTYRILTIGIRAASANGIVSVDVVRDNGATPARLASFSQGNTTAPDYWYAELGEVTPAPGRARIKWAAGHGELRLIARYPNGGTAEGIMRIRHDEDWEHPYCS